MKLTKENIERAVSDSSIYYAFVVDDNGAVYYITDGAGYWTNFYTSYCYECDDIKSLNWHKAWAGRSQKKMFKKIYKTLKELGS